MSDFLYVYVIHGAEWEDIIIFLTEEKAIEVSKENPRARVEIFRKFKTGGYIPTYNYYSNGELVTRGWRND